MVNVRVNVIGYTPKTTQGIQITSDETSTVDFTLMPESLQGEEVVRTIAPYPTVESKLISKGEPSGPPLLLIVSELLV